MAKILESGVLSLYCESLALMISSGIQTDEATYLLADAFDEEPAHTACIKMHEAVVSGESLTQAMQESGVFPVYALQMIKQGEEFGRLEKVLSMLAHYYAEEERLLAKTRSAVAYPAILMGVMTLILLFTVVAILPAFIQVYDNMTGSLAASSLVSVQLALVIAYASFTVMFVCEILVLIVVFLSRKQKRYKFVRRFEKIPFMRSALYNLALSRFASSLALFASAGVGENEAMAQAVKMIEHTALQHKAQAAYCDMCDPSKALSLSQALYEQGIFDSIHARMMTLGTKSASTEETFQMLSTTYFNEFLDKLDATIDSIEPVLAAVLALGVGVTLIAVMLPLIGIMSSIS